MLDTKYFAAVILGWGYKIILGPDFEAKFGQVQV